MNDVRLCLKSGCLLLNGHEGKCNITPSALFKYLPDEILHKLDKTTMTRGAQPYDRVPYQNRVRRWNRAVVPFAFRNSLPEEGFENGYTIMVRPSEYFSSTGSVKEDFPENIVIGENAFIYYDNRKDWNDYPPLQYWEPCHFEVLGVVVNKRKGSGTDRDHYLARVPATTTEGEEGNKIVQGIPQGIRFFEYASEEETWNTKLQLAFLAWRSKDIENFTEHEISEHLVKVLNHFNLADTQKFKEAGIMDRNGQTICPLCKEQIEAGGFLTKVEQAEGREIVDLTITEINLFHIKELRPGEYNHRVYNLGWGHHYCNIVVADKGVNSTLEWMRSILTRLD